MLSPPWLEYGGPLSSGDYASRNATWDLLYPGTADDAARALKELGFPMFRQHIEAILEAESEAKRRLAEAEQQALVLVSEAKAARPPALERSREDARRLARELIEREHLVTLHERERVLSEARARIAAAGAESAGDHFVRDAIASIAGLPP